MSRQLHVANLDPALDDRGLTRLFASHGVVRWAEVSPPPGVAAECRDGLVEMASEAEGDAAIAGLDGRKRDGRVLAVRWAAASPSASAAAAPMFGSMNMPEATPAPVSDGPSPLNVADPCGSDQNRGLPCAEPALAPPDGPVTWGPFLPLALPDAPFQLILATPPIMEPDVAWRTPA